MSNFAVHYDEKEDILYLGKRGQENDVIELSPGVNIELDKGGNMIGLELFKASTLLKGVLQSLGNKVKAA